jgi:hypothetical protein
MLGGVYIDSIGLRLGGIHILCWTEAGRRLCGKYRTEFGERQYRHYWTVARRRPYRHYWTEARRRQYWTIVGRCLYG